MKRVLLMLLACLLVPAALADDAKPTAKIKAVMYAGGGFHDYKVIPPMLAEKVGAIAGATIDVKLMNTAEDMAAEFKNPKFGQGYDVIIYDICYGEKWQDGDYDAALNLAEEGKPAVFIHCSMHTYRAPRDTKASNFKERDAIVDAKWHALLGMDTRIHDKYGAFGTVKVEKDHPILKSFPDDWKTAGDELYNTVKMMPKATPLLQATSAANGKVHTVAWVNQYGKAKIFGTTLGHDMKTAADADYHRLLAQGLLWVCGKLGE